MRCVSRDVGLLRRTCSLHFSLAFVFKYFPYAFSFFLVFGFVTKGGSGKRVGYACSIPRSVKARFILFSMERAVGE